MTAGKPSSEIAQRYVDRLAAQGIGDLDDADHETCMLARWSALMNWLDDQHEAAEIERKLAAMSEAKGSAGGGVEVDREEVTRA